MIVSRKIPPYENYSEALQPVVFRDGRFYEWDPTFKEIWLLDEGIWSWEHYGHEDSFGEHFNVVRDFYMVPPILPHVTRIYSRKTPPMIRFILCYRRVR